MIFETFEHTYRRDERPQSATRIASALPASPQLSDFLDRFGGSSYRNCLYRTIAASESDIWRERIRSAFPAFANRSSCFGYDWLGRAFALDSARSEKGEKAVVMLDLGTAEVLEIPANLGSFHNVELIEHHDAALASKFYQQWIDNGGAAPSRDQMIGYIKPLFLDGADDITNLVLVDLDVYWHVTTQLILQLQG